MGSREKLILLLAVLMIAILSGPALAVPYHVDFTADRFYDARGTSVDSPYDSISGSFVYEAASMNSKMDSLLSFDMTIGSHTYSLLNVLHVSPFAGSRTLIGGIDVASSMYYATHDFWLYWDFLGYGFFDFAYTTADIPDLAYWRAKNVDFNISEVAPVPEPATLILLGSGLLGVVIYRRKRH